MKRALLACVLLCSTQAKAACHHFTRWYYPYPQHCAKRFTAQVEEDKSWYVEFVPPEWIKPPIYLTPEQLEDSIEHNMAVMRKKDEINELWHKHQ